MSVKITSDSTQDEFVAHDIIVTTIEKSRDRVRTTAQMILSLSGISISGTLAISLYTLRYEPDLLAVSVLLVLAALVFVTSAFLAISSSFLRTKELVSTQSLFVNDLMSQLEGEHRLLRISAVFLLLGLILLVAAILATNIGGGPSAP